jgi:polysaccharide export outer membrane protein
LAKLKFAGFLLFVAVLSCSCSSYKQNIMFKVSDDYKMSQQINNLEANYIIQKNDYLQLSVYTNKGEKIIDPGIETLQTPAGGTVTTVQERYLIDDNGMAKLPLTGEVKLDGYTLKAAEEILQKMYAKYYQEPFVKLTYGNKRVVVLGAMGGQVIPLANENIKLTEVLALARGLSNDAKSHNIRIMRGQEVFVADLSTIEGYQKNNILIQPNDIIYIEPVRRPFIEGFRDYSVILSLLTSVSTLVVIIFSLK